MNDLFAASAPRITRIAPFRRRAMTLFVAAVLSGCVQSRPADLTGFGKAAAALGRQTDLSFAQANAIGRTVAIDRFVQSGGVNLTERRFPPVVPPGVARSWLAAMSELERYGLLLGSLTDAGRGTDISAAVGALSVELNHAGAGLPPGVAAGFSALAGALVEARAQRDARAVLRAADPHVRRLLDVMADAVGSNNDEGLRGTVYANWTTTLGEVQSAYAAAVEEKDERVKRAVIGRFLDGIDQRDAQLRSLAALRSSLLSLADAHAAAAAGSRRPVAELLSVLEGRLDETRRIYEAVAKEGRK